MKIAVLGNSPVANECADALRALGVLVHVVLNDGENSRGSAAESTKQTDDAGDAGLLGVSDLGGVVFAPSSASSRLIARRLVTQGVPLLVVPDARQTSSFAYELIPTIEEAPGVVIPLFPYREAVAVVELKRRLMGGEFGKVRLFRMGRTICLPRVPKTAPGAATGSVDLQEIDRAFLHDVDLLRFLGGEYKRVTAVRVGASDPSDPVSTVTEMSVTLATEAQIESQWRGTGGTEDSWKLEVIGEKGRAILMGSGHSIRDVHLEVNGVVVPGGGGNDLQPALKTFIEAIPEMTRRPELEDPGQPVAPGLPVQSTIVGPTWTDVVRAFDLTDAMHRSIRRQRTIVLQSEETSEKSQFKSQMTAIGCGVIVWSALGLVIGLGVAKTIDPRDSAQRLAEVEGMVLREADFVEGGGSLTPSAEERLRMQEPKSKGRYVVIEASEAKATQGNRPASTSSNAGGGGLDRQRQTTVTSLFSPEDNVVVGVREFKGDWYRRVMQIVWGFVFAPLGFFLLVQLMYPFGRRANHEE